MSNATSSLGGRAAISGLERARHERWLAELTSTPTAAGREHRVIAWIERWLAERPELITTRDSAGNLHVRVAEGGGAALKAGRPVYFTAHLDHPGFVVERVLGPGALQVSFRGGVMDEYFEDADVVVHPDASNGAGLRARLTGEVKDVGGPFKHYTCELAGGDAGDGVRPGDVAVWDVGGPEVRDGKMHTLACDDLAALAAALGAMDVLLRLRREGETIEDARLLLTRAEEIGFIGAIAAARDGTMARDARVIALENSRSFAESPIHGGPIVRVGDRISVFSPTLTDAIARRAEEIAGGPSSVTAAQKHKDLPSWRWQRKLMAGGACEASVYFHAGYEATCVCLPLGNYHNMADLDAVQAGTNTARPRVAREFIGVDDYHGLVDLLVACGRNLPAGGTMGARFEKLWEERKFVL